jgi:hypothetical protein
MENLKKYFIKSSHHICEDSYELGELNQVNWYSMEAQIEAINPAEAIEKYSRKILGFDFDSQNLDIDLDEGNIWHSILVDRDNFQASIEDIEKWKEGNIMLYSDNISFSIFELNEICLTEILNSHAEIQN